MRVYACDFQPPDPPVSGLSNSPSSFVYMAFHILLSAPGRVEPVIVSGRFELDY